MKALLPAAALALLLSAPAAPAGGSAPMPHLETRGRATQLIVDGRPWLILGGELNNTAATDAAYLQSVWPKLTRLGLNTVLVPVAWDWIEPEEGKFDFSVLDGALAGARRNRQKIVLLWFGSWKNGVSTFAPAWVKADQRRFPRVRVGSGSAVEVLSPAGEAALDADTRAYVALLEHLERVDAQHTTLMIQLENEVGITGDSRDRSEGASRAFAGPVPPELLQWLQRHRTSLSPDLLAAWQAAGARSDGTWQQVFGTDSRADEIFMAWQYARYMGHIAAAGKAVYPLPVFTNSWLARADNVPGDYPSGGPEPLTFDIWKAGAPAIDLNCPDISVAGFDQIARVFHRPDNPLFVPEGLGIAAGVANVFYAVGAQSGLGYSVFGIDNTVRLVMFPPVLGAAPPTDLEGLPLAKGYASLRELTPMILAHQAEGTIDAAWLSAGRTSQDIDLGGYRLRFELRRTFWDQKFVTDLGYGIAMSAGPDEFYIVGADVQVTFQPRTPGPPIAGLAVDEAGHFDGMHFTAERKLNGDDIMLNYKLAQQAQVGQSGSGARFGPEGPTIQHIKLYRYSP